MDEDRFIAIGLASSGYGGGDPLAVLEMPVDLVMDMVAYAKFQSEFQETKLIMNQENKK